MNLLLTSSGISNMSIRNALVELLGKPIAECNALFIPTAIYPFPQGAFMAWRAISGNTKSSYVSPDFQSRTKLRADLQSASPKIQLVILQSIYKCLYLSMGFKYRITADDELYFLTLTVVDWVDVFTRKELCADLLDSLKYCQQHKSLIIYAWCLMPSHLHMVVSVEPGTNRLSDVMRDFKKFTSKKIVRSINEIAESRRGWLLRHFVYAGKFNPKIKGYQFWQEGLHPIELSTAKFIEQKINYIHQNPVEAGIVFRAEDYVLSSAAQYAGDYNALLSVTLIEGLNMGVQDVGRG